MKIIHLHPAKKTLILTLIIGFVVVIFPKTTNAQSLSQSSETSEQKFDKKSKIKLKKIEVTGNSVLETEIAEIINSYIGTEIEIAKLTLIPASITRLYQERGYLTSGAVIVGANFLEGLVKIQVTEGQLETIEISGLKKLKPNYIEGRVLARIKSPLKFDDLEETRRLLILDPLLESVKFDFVSGVDPTRSKLEVDAKEAKTLLASFTVSNEQSPVIGEWEGRAKFSHINLFGNGEVLELDYGRNILTNTFKISSIIPINYHDGTWEISYDAGLSSVILTPLDEINFRIESEIVRTKIRQPVVKNLWQEVAVAGELYVGNNQNFILQDIPIGESNFFIFRVSQDLTQNIPSWKARFTANTEFSFGSADTNNDSIDPIDPSFMLLRVKTQYVQQFRENNDFLLNIRLAGQYSPNRLLSNERLALGGLNAGRGYEKDILLGDSSIFSSLELRYKAAESEKWGQLYLVGFTDLGVVFNKTNTPDPNTLAGLGGGIVFGFKNGLNCEFYGATQLIPIDSPNSSASGQGIYGKIVYKRRF